jgi:sn-glycerol 3-phosphate transport system substrate-binding protein
MRIKTILSALLLWAVCWPLSAQALTLRVTIPSGATSETTRMFANLFHQFEESEPGVKIDFCPLTDWDDVVKEIQDRVDKGQSAGLFVAELSETLELERKKLITPFGAVLSGNANEFTDRFIPEFLGNSYCSTKEFCGPPFVRSTPVALYNLDNFRSIGLDKDHLPTTWGELKSALEKLAAGQKGPPPFALGGDWYDYLFEAMVRQAGGLLQDPQSLRVSFDTPEAVEALTFWKQLKDENLLRRTHNWKSALNAFCSGLAAVTYYSSGGMDTVQQKADFPWMADRLPKNKIYSVAYGGGNLYLGPNLSQEERQAALKLTNFLYSPHIQAQISVGSGFFPVVKRAFDDPLLKERYDTVEAYKRIKRQLQYAHPKLMTINFIEIRNILKRAIDRTLDNGQDAKQSLDQAQQEADQLLSQNG